ncbi:MAG: hypothetical protein Q7R96_06175 [Nanoarchaeota archaeon]|nr:hypothetical protein [Nanoarchaeota archaeon]
MTEKPDMVAAVPDSGNCFGSSLSYHVGVESVPALLRNHYPGRVFIVEGDRKLLTKRKISIDSHAVRGKHLLIADDSSVRGTTAAELVERCYAAGAARVDMAISFPLWSHPCKYGINTKSANELLGARVSSLEDAAVAVGAKKFYAPTPVEVRRAIMGASRFHLRENDLCMACVTGDYPISVVV